MNKIGSLKDLFIEQGRELYDASRQEQKELPSLRQQARNSDLKKIIDRQITTARDQSERIEKAFKKLNVNPEGVKNSCCESMIKRAQELAGQSATDEVRDAAIINSIQRLNHNKITGFGSLTAYAREIDQPEIASSLHKSLEEERGIDKDLSRLAEKEINKKAEFV